MRLRSLLIIAAAGFTAATSLATPVSAGPADETIAGSWIVTLVDGASPRAVADEHRRNHGADVAHVYEHALRGYAARMSDEAVAKVSRDSRVESVQADRVVSLAKPTAKPGGGGGGSTVQTVPTGITRVAALGKSVAGNVTVAIIDTGIDATHPDLAANIDTGLSKNCSTGSSWSDGNGHGSHVAGTVGAINNTQGVVGVAPGVRLVAVRVLNNAGSGSWSSVICGLDHVEQNAHSIHVANMSLGGSGSDSTCGGSDTLHNAVCATVNAGVTVVVAAGNDGVDSNGFVPATYAEVITVSALADSDGIWDATKAWSATCRSDQEDTFADFSNWGADVDLIAPGVCIASTWKGGGYKTISGTSMAAPHVAGVAALYVAKSLSTSSGRPSPSQVQTALQDQANSTLEWAHEGDGDLVQERLVNATNF